MIHIRITVDSLCVFRFGLIKILAPLILSTGRDYDSLGWLGTLFIYLSFIFLFFFSFIIIIIFKLYPLYRFSTKHRRLIEQYIYITFNRDNEDKNRAILSRTISWSC